MRNILCIALVFFVSGCSTVTYRTNQAFDSYFQEKKEVAVLEPDMKIFSLTAGGVDTYKDEWSIVSRDLMREELQKELGTFKTIDFMSIDDSRLDEKSREFIDEQKGVYYTVAHSVVAHTYDSPFFFKHKRDHFDYTLGSELAGFKRIQKSDAILFVNGRNYIWTAGRASLSVLSAAVALFTGVYLPVPAGQEWLCAALVDAGSGDILWFNYLPMPGDMRKDTINRRLVKKLFKDFPKEWRNAEKWQARKDEGDVKEK